MNRKVNSRVRNKILVGLAFAVLLAASPGTAFAEGSWTSYLSGVRSPFYSRVWSDAHADTHATTVDISGCSRTDGATFLLKVELWKSVWGPDISFGVKDVSNCARWPVSVSWGDPGRGDFYLVFTHYDFGLVSASSVVVRY
jgi:hypothetical protein